MKRKVYKVVDNDYLPSHLPIQLGVILFLLHDKYPKPEWVWGIIAFAYGVAFLGALIRIIRSESGNPFKESLADRLQNNLKKIIMTPEEFANQITGRQYGDEISNEEEKLAKENGLVVVFGAYDDFMEIRGVFYEEYDCWEGATFNIGKHGVVIKPYTSMGDEKYEKAFTEYIENKKHARTITAIWAEGDYLWTYDTKIPHATFEILEDEDKYCKGIVFHISELEK